ncbi:hypothetical protein [Nocardioides bizhenqiangii]|uniref:DUF4878 domain-containing protein n=1 Tax=Nocardioides bizhenqiangii TaxID=3095076 RepID=A0ABZ0ZW61_9ACTN|nr:hypothetical protein [Nocardioides sp. HM61]WQQ28597.1 hypothetical protein SHK19_10275 [Nocardioides sp. HM61]
MPQWSRLPSTVFAVVLLLSACGKDSDTGERRNVVDASRTTGSTEEVAGSAVADAYAAWVEALARHDAAAACALQAPKFTIELRYEAILVDRAELGDPCTGFEALLWEDPEFDSEVVDVAVTQETEEDAILDVQLASRDVTVRMVYHRARWRVFSIADRTEAGTDDGTEGGPDGEAGPARWVAAWCAVSPDQTRDEIVGLMGPPSGEYTVADGGEPQLWWARDQYDFRVYLDPVDGSVLELVGDYDALGADDRALLPCPELRN